MMMVVMKLYFYRVAPSTYFADLPGGKPGANYNRIRKECTLPLASGALKEIPLPFFWQINTIPISRSSFAKAGRGLNKTQSLVVNSIIKLPARGGGQEREKENIRV